VFLPVEDEIKEDNDDIMGKIEEHIEKEENKENSDSKDLNTKHELEVKNNAIVNELLRTP